MGITTSSWNTFQHDAQSLSALILDSFFPIHVCLTFLETRKKISAPWPHFLFLQDLLAFPFLLKQKQKQKQKHSWSILFEKRLDCSRCWRGLRGYSRHLHRHEDFHVSIYRSSFFLGCVKVLKKEFWEKVLRNEILEDTSTGHDSWDLRETWHRRSILHSV